MLGELLQGGAMPQGQPQGAPQAGNIFQLMQSNPMLMQLFGRQMMSRMPQQAQMQAQATPAVTTPRPTPPMGPSMGLPQNPYMSGQMPVPMNPFVRPAPPVIPAPNRDTWTTPQKPQNAWEALRERFPQRTDER